MLALAILLLAAPSAAGAAAVIPPGNSAATQYTEALPTAGGPKGTSPTEKQGRRRPPSEVLGARTTRRLQSRGAEGQAVAEVAAETAPTSLRRSSVHSGEKPKGSDHPGGRRADSGGSAPQPARKETSGSSGLSEVAAHATGSSNSGQLGFLLPLLIVATLVWASIYWTRQRKRLAA